jgi:hypothetical protein
MIGVSTTLMGLVKVAKPHMDMTHVDQYAALAGLLFCSARARLTYPFDGNRSGLGHKCEQMADLLFVVGLVGISLIFIFFAYESYLNASKPTLCGPTRTTTPKSHFSRQQNASHPGMLLFQACLFHGSRPRIAATLLAVSC